MAEGDAAVQGSELKGSTPCSAQCQWVLMGLYLHFCVWWKITWGTEQQAESGQLEQLLRAVREGPCSDSTISTPVC